RDFRLPRLPRIPFEVTVRKPDGSPAAGALCPPWGSFQSARADDRGQIRTMRAPAPTLVYVHDPAANLASFIVTGSDDETATLILRPAATATGRVVGADGR